MIVFTHESVDGQQLIEWMAAQLKRSIDVPGLCPAQVLELLICGKDMVASIATNDIRP